MKNIKLLCFLGALSLFLVMAVPSLLAQSIVSGDINGTVADPSGAVISNATVVLKSIDRGETQTATTNPSGYYRFSLLKPGRYAVKVTQHGFRDSERQIDVVVGQVTPANFTLQMGTASEVLEVTGEAPVINVDNANVSTSFDQRNITTVPNPGGDLTNIAQTAPGVTMNTSGGYGNLTANGLPATSNLFTVNGENNMDPFFNINNSGATNLTLGLNEVQEATVTTNPYSGQYGQQAGAQVNVITKSGTNDFHGSAKYLWNGRVMNANDWFANNQNSPRPFANNNQWGADFGGPIFKNKTFFYINTEGLRYVVPTVQNTYVPTQAFADAVLANIQINQPNSLPLYQQLFKTWLAAPGISNAQPEANSCGDIIDDTGVPFSKLPGITVNTPCVQNFSATPGQLSSEWILSGRVDQNFSDNDRVFFRYRMDRGLQATYTDPVSPAFNATSNQPSYDGQAQWNHIFNSNMTNQFIVAGSWYSALFLQDVAKADAAFPYDWSFSNTSLTNFARRRSFPQGRNITQYQFIDDFSYIKGSHSLKFGLNFRRYDVSDYNFFYRHPRIYVNSLFRFANGQARMRKQFTDQTAVPLAMFGLGGYLQDEWRVKSNLKMTLALRMEHNSNPVCQTNCFSRFTGPFATLTHGPDIPYNQNIATGLNQAYPSSDSINFSPRFGFTWSPFGNDNTVISGGIGLFYDALSQGIMEPAMTNLPGNRDFQTTRTALWADPTSAGAYSILVASDDALVAGFPSGASFNQLVSDTGGLFLPPAYSNFRTMKTPQYQQWNLQVQRALGKNMSLILNYFGTHGIHIPISNTWENAYDPDVLGVGLPDVPPDPSYAIVTEWATTAMSRSNGLSTTLQRRFAQGFSFQANYTWSHALDQVSNGGGFVYGNDSLLGQLNPVNLKSNYGNADYDIRHNFTSNFVWEPPYKFSSKAINGLLGGWTLSGTIFARTGLPYTIQDSNWSFPNAATFAQAYGFLLGQPLGPGATYGQQSCGNPNDLCFDPNKFADTSSSGPMGIPTQRRNQYRGPNFSDVNFSVMKSFNVTERVKFGFGANFFNLFNHPNFANPNWLLSSGDETVGKIQSTVATPASPYGSFVGAAASPRLIQLQAKITF